MGKMIKSGLIQYILAIIFISISCHFTAKNELTNKDVATVIYWGCLSLTNVIMGVGFTLYNALKK